MSDASTPTQPERDAQAAQEAAADEAPPGEAVVADASAPVGDPAAVEQPAAPDDPSPTADEAPESPLEPAEPEPPQEAPEPLEPARPEPPQEGADPVAADGASLPADDGAAATEPRADASDAAPTLPSDPLAAEGASPAADDASTATAGAPADDPDTAPVPPAEPPRARRRRPRGQGKGRPPRRDRPERGSRGPRERGPLPFGELREAATAVAELFGPRRALREAFSVLGDKERADLARLVSEDGDWRVRARNISAGSLGAGRVGKALAAQQVSMARIEDLWALTLSKEEAAERQARVRNARRRDERRTQRDSERESRSDRVSRAELAKAQDGRVGATIRIVMPGEPGGGRRRKDGDERPDGGAEGGSDVLDRLGY